MTAYCDACPEPECCDAGWPCEVVQDVAREFDASLTTLAVFVRALDECRGDA